jgi:hypothetical protein
LGSGVTAGGRRVPRLEIVVLFFKALDHGIRTRVAVRRGILVGRLKRLGVGRRMTRLASAG